MKIKSFIKNYNNAETEEAKSEVVKGIIKTTYLPFEDKVSIASNTVASTYFQVEPKTSRPFLHISSTAAYIKFTMKTIDAYTNLDVDYTQLVTDYDVLNGIGLVDAIIREIPKREYDELDMVLKMTESDVMQNNANPATYVAKVVTEFGEALGTDLAPLAKDLIEILNDEEKTKNILQLVASSKLFKLLK